MRFSEEQISEIEEAYPEIMEEVLSLCRKMMVRRAPELSNDRAREFFLHGVCRRLKLLRQCVLNIFNLYPVKRTERLSDEELNNLQINLHAFIFNVYGITDNIAWVFLLENNLECQFRGRREDIGLFKDNTQAHLPENVRAGCKNTYRDN
jgi:hypothetical protein